jgi:hypothetical protein
MKAYKGSLGIDPLLLNLGIRRRSVSDQLHAPVAFVPQRNEPRYPWVGPRAGLDVFEKKNISNPCNEQNPGASTLTGIT